MLNNRHIGYYGMGRYWISTSHFSSTHYRYFTEVLEPVALPYLQGLALDIFQQDNVRPHVAHIVQRFFVNHQIELLPLAGSLSGSFADTKHVVHGCSTIHPDYTSQLPHRIKFGNAGKLLGLLYTKNTSKVYLNQCRGMGQR
ncbi:transposable element Tcb1 transposase [Trichonephila clavipes]|nr:transposable element Tcb1 transposase [Trichonephila clavipes]